eukprot:m.74177 g.74177  ORF g.74177 m.74177 type:complete len:163 (-) comp14412_c0_seq1:27-515(-)
MAPVRRRNKQRQSGVKQEVASTDDGDKKGGRRRKAAAAAAASGSGSSAVKKEDDGPLPPFRRPSRTAAAASASASAPKGTILVNRAPVLTLWVAVVANVQGKRRGEGFFVLGVQHTTSLLASNLANLAQPQLGRSRQLHTGKPKRNGNTCPSLRAAGRYCVS